MRLLLRGLAAALLWGSPLALPLRRVANDSADGLWEGDGLVDDAGAEGRDELLVANVTDDSDPKDFPPLLQGEGDLRLVAKLHFYKLRVHVYTMAFYLDTRSCLWSRACGEAKRRACGGVVNESLGMSTVRFSVHAHIVNGRVGFADEALRLLPALQALNCSRPLVLEAEHRRLIQDGPGFGKGDVLDFSVGSDQVSYYVNGHFVGAAGNACSSHAQLRAWLANPETRGFRQAVEDSLREGCGTTAKEVSEASSGIVIKALLIVAIIGASATLLICSTWWCCRHYGGMRADS